MNHTWAHVQQRLRRNCLIGPVAFCLIALLGMPYLLDDAMVQRLPLVEAVPFFRKAKAAAFRRRQTYMSVHGGAAEKPEPSSSTVTLEPPLVEEAAVEVEAVPTTVEEVKTETTPASTNNKKRKRSDSAYNYNFPLMANAEAFIADESAPIPFRYYEAHQHNDAVARKAVLNSLQWRKDQKIDEILNRPHPNYDVAKRVLPHYFVGRSAVTNHVVFVQRPGLATLPLAYHNDLQKQDMLDEYAYVFEYCWNQLHSNTATSMDQDDELMIGIMDLQGMSLNLLRNSDLINFTKEFVGMIDAHYPTRAYKTYMINAPGWFSTAYKLISPIMRETTKEKIVIHSAGKGQQEALEAALGKDLAELLTQALRIETKKEKKEKAKNDLRLTSDILLETEMEQEIRNFVMGRLEEEGMEMKKIVAMDN